MLDIRQVTEDFAVAPQIEVRDMAEAARRGFKMVINNRPDGESPDQPTSLEMEAAAREAGMDYRHIPVVGTPQTAQVEANRKAVAEADGPVLAFCRSGTRSIVTWSLGEAMAKSRPRSELLALGRAAGYDLAPVLGIG